ncbi:MAG: PAS domain-containing sensor histidine kinase [Bradyrhizobium sp.]|uniref:PAS domain-containing sensor histidine kinase n=1 Tax=Bradyrhizobium sp. TaxID=376 RepID=UPI0025BB9C12|nr:PAS domain-containing protein [Bradyrhizobium sp.]MBI5262591.1 PAS domain-containing sensor histidine kinase [Bradyrhizobium sp.]
MKGSEFQLRGVADPRLAVYAASPLPAWLWSVDGMRVLWANPVGAQFFNAANSTELAARTFGPAEPHRRQVARLAGTLPPNGALRLERLRGFGAPLGSLMTCGCARLEFPDGSQGILVAATQACSRAMPLVERLQRLVEGVSVPVAAFAQDGMFIGASETARPLFGFRDLSEAGLDQARSDALRQGRVELPVGIGHMVLQRVGTGPDIGLVATIAPGAAQAAHDACHVTPAAPLVVPAAQDEPVTPTRALPDYEQPAISGEAPAEFALVEECAEWSETPEPEQPPRPRPLSAAPVAQPLEETPAPRFRPLRFVWQMDVDGHFMLGSDEFMRLIGSRTAARFFRPWHEIAAGFDLDPQGRVAEALATRNTFANIEVHWPADSEERLPVELSGIPVYDRMRNFAGYKGFGVCRDLDGLNRLEALRRFELFSEPATIARALSADVVQEPAGSTETRAPGARDATPPAELPTPDTEAKSLQNDVEQHVETPQNVVPFRPLSEAKSLTLTPVENNAFHELARQLSQRLEREQDLPIEPEPVPREAEAAAEPVPPEPAPPASEPPRELPEWMQQPEPAPLGNSRRDRTLLDLLPTGILIYRLDRLLYANAAFLSRMGYADLHALEEAGGLDALYVEPGVSLASSTSEAGTPVTITASRASEATSVPTEARLHTISWDDEAALALICAAAQGATAAPAIEPAVTAAEPEPPPAETPVAGHAYAEDLAAILDTTAEGIMMFDAQGLIHACNRSAEALFGYDGEELVRFNLADLFAPESRRLVRDYLENIKAQDIASLLEHGREVLGRERKGGIIPLSMTMGRTRPDGPNFFAVFRDLSESRKGEDEVKRAERLTERAANAKADMLARISHELRTPLNAILGFAEMMIGERFGALGNERYVEYMKDIRASGQRVISVIDDLLELSRIETGRLELVFADQNLNDLVERCVTVMQPQANRERIIIRTSLAHTLPPVMADGRALRQITMNLISNSIHLASAGGQVIVSTALTDRGEVSLRVRDTGHGLSQTEVAAAMDPFRTLPPPDQASDSTGFSLSLTKALTEANRAQFGIKSVPNSGTLIEVVFSPTLARA